MTGRGRIAEAVALVALAAALAPNSQAQEKQEYDLKAGFLVNFARFVAWPADAFASPGDPVAICLYADDPFQGALERAVAGKTVGQRSVVVRRISDPAAAAGCHLLFVPASQDRNTRKISAGAAGQPVLLVGEADGFAERGGSVNFVLEGDRLRFQINPSAASGRRLRVSSKLLQLAVIVGDKEHN